MACHWKCIYALPGFGLIVPKNSSRISFWKNCPVELASQGVCDLLHIGCDYFLQELAIRWIIIKPRDNPLDFAILFQLSQGLVYFPAFEILCKIRCGKYPIFPFVSDPVKYTISRRFKHIYVPSLTRNIVYFF